MNTNHDVVICGELFFVHTLRSNSLGGRMCAVCVWFDRNAWWSGIAQLYKLGTNGRQSWQGHTRSSTWFRDCCSNPHSSVQEGFGQMDLVQTVVHIVCATCLTYKTTYIFASASWYDRILLICVHLATYDYRMPVPLDTYDYQMCKQGHLRLQPTKQITNKTKVARAGAPRTSWYFPWCVNTVRTSLVAIWGWV